MTIETLITHLRNALLAAEALQIPAGPGGIADLGDGLDLGPVADPLNPDDMTPVEFAIAMVETGNDSTEHRHQSQYHGTFHMGRKAGLDVGFPDRQVNTTRHLLGNAAASLEAHRAYVKRYGAQLMCDIHHAILWKGGPGTLATFYKKWNQTHDFDESIKAADRKVSRVSVYVARFEQAYEKITGELPSRPVAPGSAPPAPITAALEDKLNSMFAEEE